MSVLSPHPVSIMDLKHSHCRAIVQGERSEALYCGNPKDAIGSYCPGHRAQFTSYRPAGKEERSIAHSLFVAKRAA
jgi:hypothetical protein